MITGLGTDLIEVERIAKSVMQDSGFREMIFSEGEIWYCESKAAKFEHYAGRFAAKEAFFKALGTGWPSDTSFAEVEIVNDEQGKPEINLLGKTKSTLSWLSGHKIMVSISHIKSVASAVVIIEKL